MLKYKLGSMMDGGRKPSSNGHDRAGMVVTIDRTPFLLAPMLHAIYPGETLVAESTATLTADGEATPRYHRLYFSPQNFLQVVWDGQSVNECRYFSEYAAVTPASPEDWGVWLDDSEGLLGWKQFQIDDTNSIFDRLWAPGADRVDPLRFIEQPSGGGQVIQDCMLYARSTGVESPDQEYLMAAVIRDERDDSRWIQVATGLDLNPASVGIA